MLIPRDIAEAMEVEAGSLVRLTAAGRLVSHAGKLLLRVGRVAEQVAGLLAARNKIVAMHWRLSPA